MIFDYLLIILSGLLGITGVLAETHKTQIIHGLKKRSLSFWGIITLCSLVMILFLSIYKQMVDAKEAKRINDENSFLKLAQMSIGPDFMFDLSFKNSIFQKHGYLKYNEIDSLIQKGINEHKDWNEPDSVVAKISNDVKNQYLLSFIDSINLFNLFNIGDFNKWSKAEIKIYAGVLHGSIDFHREGPVDVNFNIDEFRSGNLNFLTSSTEKASLVPSISKLFDDDKELSIVGRFDSLMNAGKIFGSILHMIRRDSNDNAGYFSSTYDSSVDDNDFKIINKKFSSISKFDIQINFDADAARYFVIHLKFEDGFLVRTTKINNVLKKVFFKKILISGLPTIEDILTYN